MNQENQRSCMFSAFCGRTGLLMVMTLYAVLGAFMFKAIESGQDQKPPVFVQKSRDDCLRELWLITERLNVLYEKNWTRLVTEQLKRFERAVVDSGKISGNPNTPNSSWTFGGALLYSLTLLTTVGYGRLSPKTVLGKILSIIYAIFGVPLMLILLSMLGTMFASVTKKGYIFLCCIKYKKPRQHSSVGYHKAPTSPIIGNRNNCKSFEDAASVQIASACHATTPNHSYRNSVPVQNSTHEIPIPKRALLATVRNSHSRGRGRHGAVRQMLADPTICPTHHNHVIGGRNSILVGSTMISSDIEEAEEGEDNDLVDGACAHDTPSRIPLIWRPPDATPHQDHQQHYPQHYPPKKPSVPPSLVLTIFTCYIGVGTATLMSTHGWSFVDATYFCFLAITTIGVGEKLPQSGGEFHTQAQLLGCALYLFFGLVVVAMCLALVQDEIAAKLRHFAHSIGYLRH